MAWQTMGLALSEHVVENSEWQKPPALQEDFCRSWGMMWVRTGAAPETTHPTSGFLILLITPITLPFYPRPLNTSAF